MEELAIQICKIYLTDFLFYRSFCLENKIFQEANGYWGHVIHVWFLSLFISFQILLHQALLRHMTWGKLILAEEGLGLLWFSSIGFSESDTFTKESHLHF